MSRRTGSSSFCDRFCWFKFIFSSFDQIQDILYSGKQSSSADARESHRILQSSSNSLAKKISQKNTTFLSTTETRKNKVSPKPFLRIRWNFLSFNAQGIPILYINQKTEIMASESASIPNGQCFYEQEDASFKCKYLVKN